MWQRIQEEMAGDEDCADELEITNDIEAKPLVETEAN